MDLGHRAHSQPTVIKLPHIMEWSPHVLSAVFTPGTIRLLVTLIQLLPWPLTFCYREKGKQTGNIAKHYKIILV